MKYYKSKLYIISLFFLFVLICIKTITLDLSGTISIFKTLSFETESIRLFLSKISTFIFEKEFYAKDFTFISSLFLIALGLIFSHQFSRRLRGAMNRPKSFFKIENADYKYNIFLATYIIPLACFDFNDFRSSFVFASLIILLGIISNRTTFYYANPSLLLMGFKFYNCSTKLNGYEVDAILISKDNLDEHESLLWLQLDKHTYFVSKIRK